MKILSQAYDMANRITDMTNNPKEALQKAGVTRADLEKAKSLMNNPMASMILGDKRQTIIDGLNKAETLFDDFNLPTEQAPVSELEQMQRNLATLK
jgi:hypothetical protein